MIVVDASVIVRFLIEADGDPAIFQLVTNEELLAAPVIVDYEVISALRRLTLARDVSVDRAAGALLALARMQIERYAIEPFVDRIWSLRDNVTVYDASYVALAERLNVTMYTRNSRLANSANHRARIVKV